MKKKHKAYRHINAENISISILQNHTIPKHSFVDDPCSNPLASSAWEQAIFR